jgi:hypothetical protein
MTSNKSHKKFSLSMSTKKEGPNFTISPIPAFGGHPLQIFWRSITEARANLHNVSANILWLFLPRARPSRRGGFSLLGTQTPSSYATGILKRMF